MVLQLLADHVRGRCLVVGGERERDQSEGAKIYVKKLLNEKLF